MLSNFVSSNIEQDFDINPEVFSSGSFGYVNEGYRKKDRLHVAIKTMIDDELDYDSSVSLIRELQILATINHPKCLKLIAFSLSEPPKIVTPFMSHGSLDKYIQGIPNPDFTPTKRMCAIYGICSTMQFLHDKSIIHRDFKPENVFLDDNYDICIADFGLSRKVAENLYLTRNEIGSPIYMAPELFRKLEIYTMKIDVFSFGVSYLQFFSRLSSLDDNKGRIKDQANLYERIGNGARFIKPPNANDKQYQIYIQCCQDAPELRPSFGELCDLFETQKDLWFAGVDESEYLDYIQKCKEISESQKALKSTSSAPKTLTSKSSTASTDPKKKHKNYF